MSATKVMHDKRMVVNAVTVLLLVVMVATGSASASARTLSSNGETHCHDAAGPGILTCFGSSVEVDLDLYRLGKLPPERVEQLKEAGVITSSTPAPNTAVSEATAAIPCYAKMWTAINYQGSSLTLCNNYNDLRAVYFNDVASSIERYTGVSRYWTAINYQGTRLDLSGNIADLRIVNMNDVISSCEYLG